MPPLFVIFIKPCLPGFDELMSILLKLLSRKLVSCVCVSLSKQFADLQQRRSTPTLLGKLNITLIVI